jgi:RimJ/RimL family protein N-acetyltransferase
MKLRRDSELVIEGEGVTLVRVTPRFVDELYVLVHRNSVSYLGVFAMHDLSEGELGRRMWAFPARDMATLVYSPKNEAVGYCTLFSGWAAGRKLTPEEREIAYFVSEDEAGKGYATRAIRTISDWGRATLGLSAIYANVDPDNLASRSALANCGYQELDFSPSNRELLSTYVRCPTD